jgi:hypothetical protein
MARVMHVDGGERPGISGPQDPFGFHFHFSFFIFVIEDFFHRSRDTPFTQVFHELKRQKRRARNDMTCMNS